MHDSEHPTRLREAQPEAASLSAAHSESRAQALGLPAPLYNIRLHDEHSPDAVRCHLEHQSSSASAFLQKD